jgi:hypothetical protein
MTTDFTLEQALADITPVDASALAAITSASAAQHGATARAHTRSITRFVETLTEIVTLSADVAGQCLYAMPRGGRNVTGPSVRFSEVVASSWGNLSVTCTIMEIAAEAVVVRGIATDLERNYTLGLDCRRNVNKKRRNAKPDSDDIQLAVAVCTSIARRNVTLAVVPKALWSGPLFAATVASTGKGTLESRRTSALNLFAELGATEAQVFAALDVPGAPEMTLKHLAWLRSQVTPIREGEITVEKALAPPEAEKPRGRPTAAPSGLAQRLKPETEHVDAEVDSEVDGQA